MDVARSLFSPHPKLLLAVKDPRQELERAKDAVATGIGKLKLEDRVPRVRRASGRKPRYNVLGPQELD